MFYLQVVLATDFNIAVRIKQSVKWETEVLKLENKEQFSLLYM